MTGDVTPLARPVETRPRPDDGRTRRGRLLLRLAVAVLAGLVLAAALAPEGWGELAPLGVAALVWSQVRSQSLRGAFGVGTAGGCAFMATHVWWLQESIGTGAWLAIATSQSLWFGLTGVATAVVWPARGAPVIVAACWTSLELARQTVPFGGFPWGQLGVAVLDTTFHGLLAYVGVTGAGLVVVLLGASVVRVVDRGGVVTLAWLSLVTAASFLPLLVPVAVTQEGTMSVVVVQGDVPGDGSDVGSFGPQVTANHVTATVDLGAEVAAGNAARPDVVVWPENSTTEDPFRDGATRAGIDRAVAAVDAPVLVGALVDAPDPTQVLNQGVLWTPSGPQADRYTKHHPVPFGEYIPFRSVLGGLSDRFEEIPRDMVPGTGSQPLDIGGVPVADAICFDVAYADVLGSQVRAGAQVVTVQTSNATFVGTAQVDQQFAITRARAAELGRSVAVASTNGVTGLIAPDGSVLARSPERTTSVLQAELPLTSDLTPAVRWAGPIRGAVLAMAVLPGSLLLGRRALRHSRV